MARTQHAATRRQAGGYNYRGYVINRSNRTEGATSNWAIVGQLGYTLHCDTSVIACKRWLDVKIGQLAVASAGEQVTEAILSSLVEVYAEKLGVELSDSDGELYLSAPLGMTIGGLHSISLYGDGRWAEAMEELREHAPCSCELCVE